MSGGVAGTGVIAKVSSVVSIKTLVGIALGAFLMLAALTWKISIERDNAVQQVADIGDVIEKAEGLDKPLKPEEIIARLQRVFVARDVVVRERAQCRGTLDTQSVSIRTLQTETTRLRGLSTQAVAQAQTVIRERNGWIATAAKKDKRIARMPDADEIKEMEEAVDALYNYGF